MTILKNIWNLTIKSFYDLITLIYNTLVSNNTETNINLESIDQELVLANASLVNIDNDTTDIIDELKEVNSNPWNVGKSLGLSTIAQRLQTESVELSKLKQECGGLQVSTEL